MKYPFTKCLHPQKVVNKYTGQIIETGCGVCRACLVNKARKMSTLCDLEEQDHRYCVFVTLTYADQYIPKCLPYFDFKNNTWHLVSQCDRLNEYGQVVAYDYADTHANGTSYMHDLLDKTRLNGCLSYLSVREIQLFLKRFRKNISKYTNEKIRYYAVGEYGPKTFRAHYHILFYFDQDETLSSFVDALYKSWKFGLIDYSLSRGKCSSYVASYVNSRVSLPQLYSCRAVRPFQLHSSFFAVGFYRSQREKIYSQEPINFVRLRRVLSDRISEFLPWRSLATYFFPRCKAYSCKSYTELYYSYTILLKAKQVFPVSLNCSQLADNIIDLVSCYLSSDSSSLDAYSVELAEYFIRSCGSSDFLGAFAGDVQLSDKLRNSIYTELHISQHFLTFVCDHLTTFEIHRKIKMIIAYWKTRDYCNLTNMYRQQIEFAFECPDSSFDFFYVNKSCDVTSNPLYSDFVSKVNEDYRKSIKHKVINDLNNYYIYG